MGRAPLSRERKLRQIEKNRCADYHRSVTSPGLKGARPTRTINLRGTDPWGIMTTLQDHAAGRVA